jgi:Ran GTPase-activating protein (RanGAP) involved in mRNA processing and transport
MLGDEGVTAVIQNLRLCRCDIILLCMEFESHKPGELCLGNNGIQGAGISYLAENVCTGRLQVSIYENFSLANNPLGLEGVVDVVKILTSDHFCALNIDLSGCQLTTAGGSATNHDLNAVGVQQLICNQQQWKTRSLINANIVIDNNNFRGEGVHILATFMYIYPKNLGKLSCRSCGITSNDLKQLLVLLSELNLIFSRFSKWDLSDNDLDDDGVSALIQHLLMFPSLWCDGITLDGNIQISPGMVKTLKEELKAREVHY